MVCFNTGKPQTCLYKSVCNKSPGKTLKRLEQKKFAYNESRRGKTSCRKINFAPKLPTNIDYGNSCQKPDLNSEDYEQAKTCFLESLQKQATKRHEIERETILQAESALWLELRRCILTASNFSKICKTRPNSNSAPLVKSILYSYSLDRVASVEHGKDNEVKAVEQLSRQENISIEKCGLFIDKSLFFLGASPDGIYENGIIDIKCPFSVFGIDPDTAIQQKKLKCFKLSGDDVVMNTNHDWFYQIQGQLHIANKNVCLFAVWTGCEFNMKVVKVFRDNNFWEQKMALRLTKFYFDCVLTEIIDPRKSRSMPLRQVVL